MNRLLLLRASAAALAVIGAASGCSSAVGPTTATPVASSGVAAEPTTAASPELGETIDSARVCVERFAGGPLQAAAWDGATPDGCDPITQAAHRAVVAGMAWLGTPYAWGGGDLYGPSQGTEDGAALVGFDCSGLTRFAWASAGVLLPRNSREQWKAPGERITEMADLEPGDLIFFAKDTSDPSTIYHVGIALGNDAMLEAPERFGHVHVVHDLSVHPDRAPMFIGGLRVRPAA